MKCLWNTRPLWIARFRISAPALLAMLGCQPESRSSGLDPESRPNTRGTQLYVNLADNPRLDTTSTFGFPPVGEVTEGIAVVDSMYAEYSCRRGSVGTCPSQDSIETQGNTYVARVYPRLDFIRAARVIREWWRR